MPEIPGRYPIPKLTLFHPDFSGDPLSPEIRSNENKEPVPPEGYLDCIKKANPFITHLKPVSVEKPPFMSRFAKMGRLNFDHLTIISLPGIAKSVLDYKGGSVWQFEPHPNLEEEIEKRTRAQHLKRTRQGNKNNVLKKLETVATKTTSETGKDLDIKNLTPYQAIYLVYRLITQQLHYEDLITSSTKQDVSLKKPLSGDLSTSRPDLIPLATINKKAFLKAVTKLERQIDTSPVEGHLGRGYAVCRHIAATASVLYETLKEHQEGLLMNGSYLLYHDESTEKTTDYPLIEGHAYNLLVITHPPSRSNYQPQITTSVIEPTYALQDSESFDSTWERLSQIPSFMMVFGELFGLKDARAQAVGLARKAALRLEKYTIKQPVIDLNSFASDYATLLTFGSEKKTSTALNQVVKFLELKGLSKLNALLTTKDIPVLGIIIGTKDGNKKIIAPKWIRAFAKELRDINFTEIETYPQKRLLLTHVENSLGAPTVIYKKPSKRTRFQETALTNDGYLELCAEYMRGCLESRIIPEPKSLKAVSYFIQLSIKNGLTIIPSALIANFNKQQENEKI